MPLWLPRFKRAAFSRAERPDDHGALHANLKSGHIKLRRTALSSLASYPTRSVEHQQSGECIYMQNMQNIDLSVFCILKTDLHIFLHIFLHILHITLHIFCHILHYDCIFLVIFCILFCIFIVMFYILHIILHICWNILHIYVEYAEYRPVSILHIILHI